MKRHKIFLLVFAALLAAVQVGFWCSPKAAFSPLEKRVLADAPKFSLSRLISGRWMEQAEDYLTDHFPGRAALVGADASLRQAVGLNAAGEIYRGRDGWLIPAPLSEDTTILDKNMRAITSFAQQTGLPAVLLAVPSTGAVETDFLPALHDNYPDAALLARVRELAGDGVQTPDLLADLTARDDRSALYYRTDHHWTTAGAFAGYQAYCAAAGLEPVDAARFTVETVDGFYGTSYAKSGLWRTPADTLALWEDPALRAKVTVWDDNKPAPTAQDGLFFRAHLAEDDKYPVFLDGNHGRVRIETGSSGGRLLVVRDSFAHCLAPFLAEHYSQIDLIDLRYFKKQTVSDYLAENPADAVLFCYGLDSLATDKALAQLQ